MEPRSRLNDIHADAASDFQIFQHKRDKSNSDFPPALTNRHLISRRITPQSSGFHTPPEEIAPQ
jgi:hypothetical protein